MQLTRALIAFILFEGAALAGQPFVWDVPQVIEAFEVPGTLRSLGVPIHLQAARSKEKAQSLFQYYAHQFIKAGFYIAPPKDQPQHLREIQLTGLDTEKLVSYTVILQPNPDGSTSVIMGVAELAKRQDDPADFPPAFPGARAVIRSNLEAARTLSFSTNPGEQDAVVSYYRSILPRAGYREIEPGLYRRRDGDIRLALRPGARETVVSLISSAGPLGPSAADQTPAIHADLTRNP